MDSSLRIVSHEHAVPRDHVLAEVTFGAEPTPDLAPVSWHSGLRSVAGSPDRELWLSPGPVKCELDDGLRVSTSETWLWTGLQHTIAPETDLRALSERCFARLIRLCRENGMPHIHRCWVSLPDIHHGDGDAERYKQFCVGRYEAFSAFDLNESAFPAATVVGGHTDQLHIHLLASQAPCAMRENPRQVSAYHYPRQYGPRSPSFSRAARNALGLLISGTAAVRGADSVALGDAPAQLDEILQNLRSLLGNAADLEQLHYARLYVRDAAQAATLLQRFRDSVPRAAQWPVIEADICRPELLCEIEGIARDE